MHETTIEIPSENSTPKKPESKKSYISVNNGKKKSFKKLINQKLNQILLLISNIRHFVIIIEVSFLITILFQHLIFII